MDEAVNAAAYAVVKTAQSDGRPLSEVLDLFHIYIDEAVALNVNNPDPN